MFDDFPFSTDSKQPSVPPRGSSRTQRRVLFISYQFPPVGGVGVQRVTKFVKYLPEFGWQSSILTVSNPSVPLFDVSLEHDIPCGTIIRRAATWEPGYALKQSVSKSSVGSRGPSAARFVKMGLRSLANFLLQPDAQILWHPQAYREALRLLRQCRHEAIIASGPPFSSFLLGARLSASTGLPLVLDYRDEWGISNAYWENKGQGWLSNWIQSRQQRRAMKAACLLLATTPSSTAALARTAVSLGINRPSRTILNGFDSDDYPPAEWLRPCAASDRRFRLSFIGTLWNLNSIEPLVRAIERLWRRESPLLEQLELFVAGRRTGEQETVLSRLEGMPCQVTRQPFVDHSEAIRLMQSSDALLMLNSDVPHAERIINAKTFEYMAARRPMFVIAPRGDVWNVVAPLPGTVLREPADIEGIAQALETVLEQHRCGMTYNDATWDIDQYHRRELTRQLAGILDELVEENHSDRAKGTDRRNLS